MLAQQLFKLQGGTTFVNKSNRYKYAKHFVFVSEFVQYIVGDKGQKNCVSS